jgi:hypothetical protein
MPVSNISSVDDCSSKDGRGAVDGVAAGRLDRPQLVDRLADDVQHAAERARPDRHRDGAALVHRLHAAHHAVGRQHADAAHAVLAQVLLDLDDDVDGYAAARAVVGDAQRLVDGRHLAVELHVDHRSR